MAVLIIKNRWKEVRLETISNHKARQRMLISKLEFLKEQNPTLSINTQITAEYLSEANISKMNKIQKVSNYFRVNKLLFILHQLFTIHKTGKNLFQELLIRTVFLKKALFITQENTMRLYIKLKEPFSQSYKRK